jgi:hypothetical protein
MKSVGRNEVSRRLAVALHSVASSGQSDGGGGAPFGAFRRSRRSRRRVTVPRGVHRCHHPKRRRAVPLSPWGARRAERRVDRLHPSILTRTSAAVGACCLDRRSRGEKSEWGPCAKSARQKNAAVSGRRFPSRLLSARRIEVLAVVVASASRNDDEPSARERRDERRPRRIEVLAAALAEVRRVEARRRSTPARAKAKAVGLAREATDQTSEEPRSRHASGWPRSRTVRAARAGRHAPPSWSSGGTRSLVGMRTGVIGAGG